MSLGLQEAGFDVALALDNSRAACETHSRNLAARVIQADIRDVTGEELLSQAGLVAGECELVAGGPPCQGFSVQRRGDDDDARNKFIFEFLRLVTEIAPPLFLMENVSAIRGPRGKVVLDRFLSIAKRHGYYVSIQTLDAVDFQVAQRRRRAFIVGERTDRPSLFSFPPPEQSAKLTVRDAIGDLPNPESPEARAYANHEPVQTSELNRLRISYVPQGGGREDIPAHLQLPCHRISVATAGHRQVYGRLHWDRPAATITTKCNSFTRGMFAHPGQDRNITMREAARIQGFPDWFVFEGGRVEVAHQIGNAVPPLLAKVVGQQLIRSLRDRLGQPHERRPRPLAVA
jgi:DNA (cytosine-5)-methyltransferase 1